MKRSGQGWTADKILSSDSLLSLSLKLCSDWLDEPFKRGISTLYTHTKWFDSLLNCLLSQLKIFPVEHKIAAQFSKFLTKKVKFSWNSFVIIFVSGSLIWPATDSGTGPDLAATFPRNTGERREREIVLISVCRQQHGWSTETVHCSEEIIRKTVMLRR